MRKRWLGLTFALSIAASSGLAGPIGVAAAQTPASSGAAIYPPVAVVKFSTLNTDGTPVPCELTLAKMRGVLASVAPSRANRARFEALRARGIERCSANDDVRANAFLAEALGMVGR